MNHGSSYIKKLVFWTLSNILASGENMIARVFLKPMIIDKIIESLNASEDDMVKFLLKFSPPPSGEFKKKPLIK